MQRWLGAFTKIHRIIDSGNLLILPAKLAVVVLAEAWEGNDLDNRGLAGVVIRQLGARNDSRLADYRARILRRAHSLATKIVQETGILPSEYYVIRDVSREQAIDFILACLQTGQFKPGHLQFTFREVMMLGGIARIEQLAAQGGPLGGEAAIYLDQCGPITPEKIAAKSEHWRKRHDAQDLKWLFHRHIDRNTPQRSGIDEMLGLLGEPSERGERFFSWKSKGSPVHLHLETDESGKLDWMRLYED